MMLEHNRYCEEIVEQSRLLAGVITDTELSVRVPTCPDWSLAGLAAHVGGAHRWVAEIVRRRADTNVPDDQVPDREGPGAADPVALAEWLTDGARLAADELRAAGPDTEVWTWFTDQRAAFWARRMAHETVIHQADAALAAGVPFVVAPEVAADTVDEWLELVSSPLLRKAMPTLPELDQRAGSTLHLHATDTPPGLDAEWLIELGAEGIVWRRAHQKAAVALRGPLADVLLVFYRRLPAGSGRVEVLGDAGLLDFWLERVSFG